MGEQELPKNVGDLWCSRRVRIPAPLVEAVVHVFLKTFQ